MSVTSNSGFLGQVKNTAEPLSQINASIANFNTVNTSVVNANSVNTNSLGVSCRTLVGFAPTGYSTLASGSALTLVSAAGYSPTGAGDTHLLTVPAGSFVKSVIVDDNGVANTSGGDATIDVGFGPLDSAPTVDALATGDLIGNTILIAGPGQSAASTVGGTGAAPVAVAPAAPGNYLNVQVNTSALTAGDMRAVVEYCTLADQ